MTQIPAGPVLTHPHLPAGNTSSVFADGVTGLVSMKDMTPVRFEIRRLTEKAAENPVWRVLFSKVDVATEMVAAARCMQELEARVSNLERTAAR